MIRSPAVGYERPSPPRQERPTDGDGHAETYITVGPCPARVRRVFPRFSAQKPPQLRLRPSERGMNAKTPRTPRKENEQIQRETRALRSLISLSLSWRFWRLGVHPNPSDKDTGGVGTQHLVKKAGASR